MTRPNLTKHMTGNYLSRLTQRHWLHYIESRNDSRNIWKQMLTWLTCPQTGRQFATVHVAYNAHTCDWTSRASKWHGCHNQVQYCRCQILLVLQRGIEKHTKQLTAWHISCQQLNWLIDWFHACWVCWATNGGTRDCKAAMVTEPDSIMLCCQ